MNRKPKASGEREVFAQIWAERPHVCANCQGDLGHDAKAWFFSHDLRKSQRPDLRLDPSNITLRCMACHRYYDDRDLDRYEARAGTRKGKYVGGLE